MDSVDTKQLVLDLKGGSPQALGELYDRYNRLVYRTALGVLGDPEAASDLLQEVFMRLFRFAERIDPDRPLEPWLYRMTVNLCYTWVKRRKWWQSLEDIADFLAGDHALQPSVVAERHETWDRVNRAVTQLPLPQRLVVVLHYIDDCSLQEIAEILEVPEGTVKSRLHYARLSLRQLMEDHPALKELNYEFT